MLGWVHVGLRELDVAAACFERSLRLDPEQPELWSPLGGCLLELGRPAGALHVLETAVSVGPDDGCAWARLGAAYEQLGRSEDAEHAFRNARDFGYEPPWNWDSAARYGKERLVARERLS
jgi:Flp pilus assembly protein TadD